MRIRSIDPAPFHSLPYFNVPQGGGVECVELPLLRGVVDRLPDGLDAVVVTSDLQGRAYPRGDRLVGEELADELLVLAELELLPAPERVGVLLAGDLWGEPDRRGGVGDVRPVWRAFRESFRWVVGVAGNHDDFGDGPDAVAPERRRGVAHLLDENSISLDGLRVGGVGGIIGNPRKLQRRSAGDFEVSVRRVLEQNVDVLVLHQGPDAEGQTGAQAIRVVLESARRRPLVICGHSHWRRPLATLKNGTQVLNVDHRVVVLETA